MNQQFQQRLILLCLFVFSFFFTNAQNGRTGPGSAIPINVIPSTGVYDNLPSNGTANSITGVPFSDSRDRWFRVTLPPNRTITVSTCGGATNFDDEIFIVDDDGSTVLALDGGSCSGILGVITNFTVPGSDPFVYVVVEGQEIGMEGDFFLSITSSCPNPPTASNQNFCNTPSFTARVSNLVATGAGGTLNWYNVPTGGSALASTTALTTGTYYVAEQNAGCVGGETPRTSITVGVNPTPTVNSVPDQVLCNNAVTNAVNFTGSTAGTVYSWTNNNTNIGLGANGTGNIAPFNATNSGPLPDTATITVTPSFTANGFTCTGTPTSFRIVVYPSTVVNPVTPQVLCNGAATTPINFSSTTVVPASTIVYNWTNNDPSIGLAASGSGNIPSFAATNTTNAPVVATVTVTPTFTYQGVSCIGLPSTFTITVHPTATVTPISNQTHCRGVATSTVNFTSPATGGTVTYAWTNSNTAIGLAASGTGNIPSFTTTNTTTAPIVATITVTPTFTDGTVTCVGTATTFTITVNPTTSVTAVTNKVYCAGTVTSPEVFTGPVTGTVFSWSNDNTAIGLAASGTGDLPSFTTTNTTSAPILATITVTSATPDNCAGTSTTFTITVYPTATVSAVYNQIVCAGANTTAVNFSSPATGGTVTYAWTNNTPSIGLAASGIGNIAAFAAFNAGTAPVTATITVTPTYTVGLVNCVGTPTSFTITVNPTATVN
ncbi:MAG: beta strand repeat-containing protein, partial [Ferruginibacter sp.]